MYSPRIVSSARKAEWIGVNCSVADDFNSLNRIYEGYSTQACYQYARFAPKKELGSVSIKIESPYLFFPELPAFGPKMPCSIIVFRGVSAEYDRYWKTSLQKMMTYMDEEDPTQWLDDSSIYSNI